LTPTAAPPFISCADQSEIPQSECNALVALYNNTGGSSWSDQSGWLKTGTPCSWFGVTCNSSSHVTGVDLAYNGLSGSIPAEFCSLSNLQYLNLSDNQLSGSIPADAGNMSNLVSLNLGLNQLTGSIPVE
jgi:Leucine-rich repeat (LRR) protein